MGGGPARGRAGVARVRAAAIDIGTNSARLLIGELDDPHGELVTRDRRMTITRLGQGVDATRRLAPEAIERTVAALRDYRQAIDAVGGVTQVRATATSAARDAANRDDFFGPAPEALGVMPELLSGGEEARLSFLGATAGLEDVARVPTSSSTSAAAPPSSSSAPTRRKGWCRSTSDACGSPRRVAQRPADRGGAEPGGARRARAPCRRRRARFPAWRRARTLVGLAGTVTTVAVVELGLREYDRDRVHHFRLTRAAAEDVFRTLATEAVADRRHNPGLEPGSGRRDRRRCGRFS